VSEFNIAHIQVDEEGSLISDPYSFMCVLPLCICRVALLARQ
jgi:hypothetical protein